MRNFVVVLIDAFSLSSIGGRCDTFQRGDQIKASWSSNLTAMAFGYTAKPNFTVDNEKAIANPAKVDFGKTPAKPTSEAAGVPK